MGALLGGGRVHGDGHLRGTREPVLGLLGRRACDDVVEGLDEIVALRAGQRTWILDVRPELGHVVVLRVRHLPGEHLVEHAAQRVDVGAAIDRPGPDLLGRDVVRRADPGAGARQAALRPEPLGEAEVGQVDVLVLACAAEQDVGRLDVAMHQAALVCGVECRGHRRHDALHAVEAELAAVDHLAQVRAGHEAHRQVQDAAILAAAMDGDDVRMLERCREPCLRLEASHRVRVLRVLGRDDLQRDRPAEVLVGRAVDDSHPAAIEHAVDAVAREERSRLEARQALNGFIHDSRSRGRHPRPCAMVRPSEPSVKAARSARPGDPDPSEGVPERPARARFEPLRGVFAGLSVRCAEPGGRLRLRGAWVWRTLASIPGVGRWRVCRHRRRSFTTERPAGRVSPPLSSLRVVGGPSSSPEASPS